MKKLISYCTTCCNRLWQLALTLPKNLKNLSDDEELVLVNYGSQDNLNRYIESSDLCKKFIIQKKLIYANVLNIDFYHSCKAKNLAHRLANGKYLVNLDGDNFNFDIKKNILKNKDKETLYHFASMFDNKYNRFSLNNNYNKSYQDGTFGKIALTKRNFYKLGGYDESFYPMGYQDWDLIIRSLEINLKYMCIPLKFLTILNTKEEKIKNIEKKDYNFCNESNAKISEENIKNKIYVVNTKNGWGEAEIILNFKEKIKLNPIFPNPILSF